MNHIGLKLVVLNIACGLLNAQAEPDPTEVLFKAREALLERTEHLQNYTCIQTVNRFYYQAKDSGAPPHSCDESKAARKKQSDKLQLEATDRLRLEVKVSGDNEIGSWVGANQFDSRSILDLVGGGPFGTGPLGTQIGDIFGNDGTEFEYVSSLKEGASVLLEYHYYVPVEFSHYKVKAGSDWVISAFDGTFRIDANTYELKQLAVRSSELPAATNACEATTTVDYQRIHVGVGDFLVPRESSLHFVMRDGSETENRTAYSNCHEYHGEATIHFEDMPATEDVKPAAGAGPIVIPAGLAVVLELAQAIDTDEAAAGDAVRMKVHKAVTWDKKVLIPAGAAVGGRITQMRRIIQGPTKHFEISVALETVELGHTEVPFHAAPDRSGDVVGAPPAGRLRTRGMPITLPPRGSKLAAMTLFIPTENSRYVVARGYLSKWTTLLGGR